MSVESKRLNPDYPAMEQEYSDTNDFAPSCSTGQGFGRGFRDSYGSGRGGSSFESRGGGSRECGSSRVDRGERGGLGSRGRDGDRPMRGSYGDDRRGPPQRHSSMDRSYSDRAQPAMRRDAPVEEKPNLIQRSISLNRKKGGRDASKLTSKTVTMQNNVKKNTCTNPVDTPYPIPENFQITFGWDDSQGRVKTKGTDASQPSPKVAPLPPRVNDNEYTSSVSAEKPKVVEKDKEETLCNVVFALRDSEDDVNASKFSPKVEILIEDQPVSVSFKEKAKDGADEEKDKIIAKLKDELESMKRQQLQDKQQISELKKENSILKTKACNDGAQGVPVQENTGTSPSNGDRLFEFNIPSVMYRLFIGKGGWRIKLIRQQSGAKIHLQNNPSTPQFKTCVIEGTLKSIHTACSIIKKEIPDINFPDMDRTPAANPVIRQQAAPRPYSLSHQSRRSLPELEIKDKILKGYNKALENIQKKKDQLKTILFIDLDNYSNFFEDWPPDEHLPENLYVVGFNGGDQTWSPLHSVALFHHVHNGLFSLVLCGKGKDAADNKLKEMGRSIDSTTSLSFTFFILSADNGFLDLFETIKNRHVEIQNPHVPLVRNNLKGIIFNHMKE